MFINFVHLFIFSFYVIVIYITMFNINTTGVINLYFKKLYKVFKNTVAFKPTIFKIPQFCKLRQKQPRKTFNLKVFKKIC